MAQYAVDLVAKVQGGRQIQDLANKLQGIEGSSKKAQASLNGAATGISNTGRAAATATGNIQRFGIAFRSTVAPIVAAYGALNFFNKALGVMGSREADANILANGLRNLGRSEKDLRRLQKAASDLGEATLFNQEDFTQAFGLLTSFRAIGVASYERVAKAAADVATVTKTDVNSAMLQLAKALENPVEGMSALSRSGTTFTKSQKEIVKSLVESGRQLEAQEYILRIVEGQYKGAAKEAATGFAGAMDTLGETFRDFQEVVGKGVLPVVTELIKGMTDTFRVLSQVDPKIVTAASKAAVFAAKLFLVSKALKALLGLRAAAVGALAAIRTGMIGVSGAAVTATGSVNGLSLAIRRFLPLAAAMASFEFLSAGARAGAGIEELRQRLGKGGSGAAIASGGSSQTRESVTAAQQAARATIKSAEAELKRLAPNGWLGLIPGLGAADAAMKGSRAQILRGRIADAKSVLGLDPQKFKTEAEIFRQGMDQLDLALDDGPDTGGGSGGGKSKGDELAEKLQESLKAGRELSTEFTRQIQLLNAQSELEKELLQIRFDTEDNQARINELLDPQQRKALELLNTELERLKVLKAQVQAMYDQADAQSLLDKKYKEGSGAFRTDIDLDPNKKQGKIQDYMSKLETELADTEGMIVSLAQTVESELGSAMSNAISGLIDGTQTAEQAFSQMFKNIGKAFIDMATQMLAQKLVLSILGAFAGGGGGSLFSGAGPFQFGGGGSGSSMFGAGAPSFFAEGGFVTGPTRALIGEGGESEYVIPASKMGSAMQRWNAGARGNAVVDGSARGALDQQGGGGGGTITIESRVINSVEYVTLDQARQMSNEAAILGAKRGADLGMKKTIDKMRNSPGTRRGLGM